ncbi:MAG: patatin-like phospholipase family protein [Gammaproteobacteria bacterium]|nr:patatin-like phospholipase family protein [Gammaproteobacteria bacterium]
MFWNKTEKGQAPKIALLLSGGGARAAYQVGVLKALADVLPKDAPNPFPIISGTSAGAINAAAMAIYSSQFREAVWRLVHVWGNFHVDQVFRADLKGLSSSAMHWIAAITLGGLGKYNPVSLLDREPLEKLLGHYMPFEKIQDSIDKGYLESICITASSYTSGHSVSFFQGHEKLEEWQRMNRVGIRSTIGIKHLMASSAIPFVFAAERLGNDFYGDGSMRQNMPTSPALHLGADKLFIVGNKHEERDEHLIKNVIKNPSLGQVAGHVLDSIFLDNVSMDVERLRRINKNLEQIPDKHLPEKSTTFKKVEILYISPSKDLFSIAQKHYNLMPKSVRLFLRGLGTSKKRSSNLISYLLFEKEYCRELITLGYADTIERKAEVLKFMQPEPTK